ncbi:MAG: hypothetical protein UHJ41_07190, partial [Bacteroidaceae bacterium]|nr:hypothetical protein [Bacteroidaceae bacterium]
GYTTRIYEFAVYGYLKGDDPTDIGTSISPADEQDGATYNLAGQRTGNTARRGIYIRNGKKVVVP